LEQFGGDYNKQAYGRQIAKKLNLNQKTVSNILQGLEKGNILKFTKQGKNKLYFLNRNNNLWRDTVKLIELGKKIKFLEKHKNKQDLFVKLEEATRGISILFGSYASGLETKESDIDIVVESDVQGLESIEKLYDVKINPIKIKKPINPSDVLMKEIIENHIVLNGVEEFIKWI